VILSLSSGLVPWILPPVLGAAAGAALGWSLLGRAVPSLFLRRRGPIERAASKRIEPLTRWALDLTVADLALSAGSPAALALEDAIAGALVGVLGSRSLIYTVRDLASQAVAALASKKVRDIAAETGLAVLLDKRVLPLLAAEPRKGELARTAGTLAAEQAGAALGDETLRELSGVFESYVPEAVEAVARWLHSPDTRTTLSERGRELIPRILEKLSELQKLFISAGQFDRRLNEKMPEIVDDTIAAAEKILRDPQQQLRIVEAFFESTKGWRDSLLVTSADMDRPWSDARQKLADSTTTIVNRLLERMDDPVARRSIAAHLEQSLLTDRRTLGAFARDVFGIQDTQIVELLSARVLAFLVRPETARAAAKKLCGVLVSFLDEHARSSIAAVLRMGPDQKRKLDEALRARIPRMVDDLLPLIAGQGNGARLAGLAALFGAGLGLFIGSLIDLLRLIGYR
jgi:hypothetical protein